MESVFISGCGDIGERVAKLCMTGGLKVYALVRSEEKAQHLQQLGIQPVMGDLDNPSSLKKLPLSNGTVFHFAPPPSSGQTDPRVDHLLAAIDVGNCPEKIVAISTTAVYGDCQGAWITEQTPVNPQTDRGKRRLYGEHAFSAWGKQHDVPVVILRLGGIYGPRRLPIERIKKGLPILKENLSPFTNRIHEDDLANICVLAAEKAPAGAIYNVSDGKPGTMSRYFKDIAAALDLPLPSEVDMEEAQKVLSPGMLSYLQESRRIDNTKLIKELGVQLKYPDFHQGLEACVKALSN